jgi:hypothetical protein
VTASGVDTLSLAFRPERQSWSDRALEQPHVPTGRGGWVFRHPGPGGTKLGGHGQGLVWWEGRLDALLSASAQSWDLRPARDVAVAERVARDALERVVGMRLVSPPAEVRRFDLAHEFEFDDGGDGLAFLRTAVGMCPPRRVIDTFIGQDGQPQTVYVRQAKSGVVTERLYDKGVESGSHDPGHRLRYEAQRRPPRPARMTAETLAAVDLAPEYGRSINAYMKGNPSVIAAGSEATIEHLAGAVARDEISIAKAERMAGTLAFLGTYGRAIYGDERKARRRLQGLREAGVAVDTQLSPDRVVPVGELLAQSVESFRA